MMAIYQGVFLFAVGIGPWPGGVLAERAGLAAPFVVYAVTRLVVRRARVAPRFPRRARPARPASGAPAVCRPSRRRSACSPAGSASCW